MDDKIPKGTPADKIAYGEIRSWAIKSLKDFSAPTGLGNAKASMLAVSTRNTAAKNVASAGPPKKTAAPADKAAWKNIVESTGTDKSKKANYFCVGHQNCDIVNKCWYWEGKTKKKKKRSKKLLPVATISVGSKKIYFYKDKFKGWCDAEAFRGPIKK